MTLKPAKKPMTPAERREAKAAKEAKPELTQKQKTIEFLKSLGFALIAVIILNSFVIASFQVPTGSMENTVMAGDLLFVNKFIYGGTTPPTVPILGILFGTEIELPYFRVPGFRDPKQGDVIVFIFPGNRNEVKADKFNFYLKRCVGVSRDTVQVVNKLLLINGKPSLNPSDVPGIHYADPNVMEAGRGDPDIFPPGKPWNRDNWGPFVIPGKGDVIQLTTENLLEWDIFIQREGHKVDVRGNEILIDGNPATSYTVERDYVFGMGDNRDNSSDGRYWGCIPKKYVVGTPMVVYWSWDPDVPIFNLFKKLGSVRLGRIGTIVN
jgi:signal peptidase I